ncbi:MAG: phosphate ABC transporter substrate-binding protein [bacterium]|nr:phosphate ABC transporter substrate-binding protein [bacterium]
MRRFISFLSFSVFVLVFSWDAFAQNPPRLRIVGSTTMYPFSSFVAEHFGVFSDFRTPIVEATGTGGGINLFCTGTTINTPSIANAARPMTLNEEAFCLKNQVTPIEIVIGYDGIVISGSKESKPLKLKKDHLFQALASHILKNGSPILNPHKYWSDIDKSLPRRPIKVLGPPATSGTYDVFIELAIQPFCSKEPALQKQCGSLRTDGAYKAASEHGNVIAQKLLIDPETVGIFGYTFLDANQDRLWGASIDGVGPTTKSIADSLYPLSHPFYLYLKKEHLILVASMTPFAELFLDEDMSGPYTALSDKGLIPLDPPTRQIQRDYLIQETTY